MTTPIFTGRTSRGKLLYDAPARFIAYLAKLGDSRVEVVVRKPKSQRSIQQNKAYWGIPVEIIAEYLGWEKDAVHIALKEKFASHRDEKTGLLVIESTAAMDTKRFNKYYEDIQRWAAEFLGVDVPSPNEADYGEGA